MAYTDEQRAEAVALYAAEGLAEAHHQLDIPRATLRLWVQKAGYDPATLSVHTGTKTTAANQATRERWETLRTTMADKSGNLAARVLNLIAEGLDDLHPKTTREIKDMATVAGILIDKAQLLDGHATSRTEVVGPDRLPEYEEVLDRTLRLVQDKAS